MLVAISVSLIVGLSKKKGNLTATICCRNDVLEVVDLSKENEPRSFVIQGEKSLMTIEVKHDAIRVIESECPHHDCINMGWVNSTNKPIICAYNAVYITLTNGTSLNDVEVI